MEQDQHFVFHLICIGLFALLNYFVRITNDWWLFLALIPSWIVNPDLDKLFDKMSEKIKQALKKKGRVYHRNFLTHSIILPLGVYASLRHFVMCNFGTGIMWEVALWCFFPVLIHLVGDLKFWGMVDLEFDEMLIKLGKKNVDMDRKEFGGTWQISCEPLSHKRLGFKGTYIWLYINIGLMIGIMISLYFVP